MKIVTSVCAILVVLATTECVLQADNTTILTPILAEVWENSNFTMTCQSIDNKSHHYMYWKLNDKSSRVNFVNSSTCKIDTTDFHLNNLDVYRLQCRNSVSLLTILNVNSHQQGDTWQCLFGFALSQKLRVFVKVKVKTVDIVLPKGNVVGENETLHVNCKTSYCRPMADIQWFLSNGTANSNDDKRITDSILQTYDNDTVFNGSNPLTATMSKIQYKVERRMNGLQIYCRANNSKQEILSSKETLNITYPPEVPPYIDKGADGHKYSVISTFQGNLSCSVKGGNPLPILQWNCTVDGNPKTKIINKTVVSTITWTASSDHSKTCTCYSVYKGRISSDTIEINVLYPPSRLMIDLSTNGKNKNVSSDLNMTEYNTFSLTCRTKSNPSSNFSWNGPINSTSESLQFFQVQASYTGAYTCTATNVMIQSNGKRLEGMKSANINLNILYPPRNLTFTIQYSGKSDETVTETVNVIENDTFSLKCSARGNPKPIYYWTGPSQSNSDTLIIKSAVRNLNDTCTCFAKNVMEESTGTRLEGHMEKVINLNIQYPPEVFAMILSYENKRINLTSKIVKVVDDDSFNITCLVTSKPASIISWKGGKQSSTHVLEIQNVKGDMGGMYTCYAENEIKQINQPSVRRNTSRTIQLDVLYAPVVHPLSNRNVLEGTSFNITCKVTPGNPNITRYEWSRNNTETVSVTSYLHLTNVSRSDDMVYTCTAFNIMKPTVNNPRKCNSNASFHMNVLYSTTIEEFFLEGFKNLSDVEINQTRDSILHNIICRVSSNPVSNLTLRVDTKQIYAIPFTDLLRYNLSFKSCSDAGIYSCFGENGIKTKQPMTKKLKIRVKCAPELSMEKPLKQNITSALHVPVTIKFDCLANPEPESSGFNWYRVASGGLIDIETDDKYYISSHGVSTNLTIYNVTDKDFGQYKLRVENMMGVLEKIFNVIAQGKPETPSEFSVIKESVSEKAATIKWKPGFNGGLEQYFILKFELQGDAQVIAIGDTGDSFINYTIDGLESASTYLLELFSVNPKGNSNSVYTLLTTKDKPRTLQTNANIAGPVAGGIVSGIFVLIAVILGIILFKRRSSLRTNKEAGQFIYQNVQFNERNLKKKSNARTPTKKETSFQVLQDLDDIPAVNREPTDNSPDKTEQIDKIRVQELLQYVLDKSEESFGTEYQKLPSGLQKPCTFARRPDNIALNRYNGIYPYDHSRVRICGEPDFYINACYIDGYAKPNAYIASLGPVKKATDDFKTFWMMVWSERSDIIVMLTNLQEPSGMKCEQYWPDIGTSTLFGDIQVTCDNEEAFAEYTTRSLTVSKDHEQRSVTHLHYTAWPDKKVPEDVTTLIELRERMKATPSTKKGPIIVHCSAGIGRTGTLIALDRLIEEGQRESAVDVFKCVNRMREQRVKMVQTQEQYIYIYKALVNSLYFDSEMIPVETFQEYVVKTNNNIYSKQFQQLIKSVEECSKEELDARCKNELLIDKNRRGSDIPGCHHRVNMYVNRQMNESNYINAVYINSLKKKDHFIIAQSPLLETVSDFVCMIYQENCCCVVTMEDLKEPGMTVGQYLPYGGQTLTFGNMQVSCTVLETKPHYSVRKLKIKDGKSESGGTVAYHFQYKKWVTGCDVPSDPKEFVQFIKDVEEYANDLGEDKSHVLVHCLKANERSALYCIVSILMEKMRYERQGSVLNTVRHLRTRRRTAITSMEQLKFCYQAVSAYISMYET